ncbi:hypothetical protein [Streptomyces sp. NRRL S-448]|uniref:hypothetical protein n=1 Tax=Streptomyces sp. NRRL S-448 TaxID=1463907 RepID=UPI003562ED9A
MWGGRADLLRVAPLAAPGGGQVLVDAAPEAGTAEAAERLSVRLGGLPLAVHAAGRHLAAPGSRYRTSLARRWAAHAKRLLNGRSG